MTRVVITGMGALTPIGNDVASFQAGLDKQKVGFEPITYFDSIKTGITLAGQLDNFNPLKRMTKKDTKSEVNPRNWTKIPIRGFSYV